MSTATLSRPTATSTSKTNRDEIEEIFVDMKHPTVGPVQKVLARHGIVVSGPTWWRWRVKGINGVHLPALLCGKVWYSTDPAIMEFLRRQTANSKPKFPDDADDVRSEDVARRLEAAGLVRPSK